MLTVVDMLLPSFKEHTAQLQSPWMWFSKSVKINLVSVVDVHQSKRSELVLSHPSSH